MTDSPENKQTDTEYRARAAISYILYSCGQLSSSGNTKALLLEKNPNRPNLYSISIKGGERRDYDVIAGTLQRLGMNEAQVDVLPLRVTIPSEVNPFEKLALFFTAPNGAMEWESADISLISRIAKEVASTNPVKPTIDRQRQNQWPATGARHSVSQALKKQKVQLGDVKVFTSEDGLHTYICLAPSAVPYRDALKKGLSESGFVIAKGNDEDIADRISLEGNVVSKLADVCCITGKLDLNSELLRRFTENVQHHLLTPQERMTRWTDVCKYVGFSPDSPSR